VSVSVSVTERERERDRVAGGRRAIAGEEGAQ